MCHIKGLRRPLATSDRGSEMVIVLGHGLVLCKYSLPLPKIKFPFLPLMIILGYALVLGLGIEP